MSGCNCTTPAFGAAIEIECPVHGTPAQRAEAALLREAIGSMVPIILRCFIELRLGTGLDEETARKTLARVEAAMASGAGETFLAQCQALRVELEATRQKLAATEAERDAALIASGDLNCSETDHPGCGQCGSCLRAELSVLNDYHVGLRQRFESVLAHEARLREGLKQIESFVIADKYAARQNVLALVESALATPESPAPVDPVLGYLSVLNAVHLLVKDRAPYEVIDTIVSLNAWQLISKHEALLKQLTELRARHEALGEQQRVLSESVAALGVSPAESPLPESIPMVSEARRRLQENDYPGVAGDLTRFGRWLKDADEALIKKHGGG